MHGLSVRWSLAGVPDRVADELAAYVESTSHARFTGMDGLRFKVWRMRRGEWFEGTYLFTSPEARAAFEEEFLAGVAEAPGTRIVGAPPCGPCTSRSSRPASTRPSAADSCSSRPRSSS